MHSSLIAVVLCFFAQAALAQCVDVQPLAQDVRQGSELIKKAKTSVPSTARPGGELIKTAAAGTHDAPAIARDASPRATAPAGQDDTPRRGGPAMLLAALALMSGIALRRYGSNRQ